MFPIKRRPGGTDRTNPPQVESEADDARPDVDELRPGSDVEMFKPWFRASRDHWGDWREQAREDYAFVAGDQWNADDKAMLREQTRPVVTFNRIGPFIDSVEGHEINNRTELRFIPRTMGDSGVNELLTGAAKWVRDQCDAEDEETTAFVDMVICGLGWTDTRPDYDDDPDGEIRIERVDPMEMFPDASARKGNLSDMQYCFRVKEIPVGVARKQYSEFSDAELDAKWARSFMEQDNRVHEATNPPEYRGNYDSEAEDTRDKITLVECQWWEYETAWRVADPAGNKWVRLDEDQYAMLKRRVDTVRKMGGTQLRLDAVRDKRKVYYKATLGNVVLDIAEGPKDGGFTWKCMTGKRDRNNGVWYGIVRSMKDPQRWGNKWLSQTMHVINTNAKGGLMAESDAFENPREAADTWAQSDAITYVQPGALVQGKIQPKPPITYPAGLDRLMEFAISSIPAASGINPDMLGMTTSQQPGVAAAEFGRRQQAMAILGGMFNAKRRYVKEQGRLLLWMIQEFISDGRLVRIGGEENAQFVPLVKQEGMARYDVIVDDTPTSPNQKERTFGVLMQMMPMLSRLPIPPQIWMELLKYSPLPESLTSKIMEIVKQQAAQPQQGNQLEAALAQAEQAHAAERVANAKLKAIQAEMSPRQMAMDAMEQQAKIENMKAQSIAALHRAGIDERGMNLEEMQAALDGLLRSQGQSHDQMISRHQATKPAPSRNPA